MYKFENANGTKDFDMSSSKICSIYDDLSGDYGKNHAMALGQLKYLFGEPSYITNDIENQFSYDIKAVNESGDTLFLNVYSAGTGSAIGGLQDRASEMAARELSVYIQQAKTKDYDYEGYYLDGPAKIRHGVKNGEPYWEEKGVSVKELERNGLI